MALRKVEDIVRIDHADEPIWLVERVSGQTWKATDEDGNALFVGIPDFRAEEVVDKYWFTFHREGKYFVFDDKYVDED